MPGMIDVADRPCGQKLAHFPIADDLRFHGRDSLRVVRQGAW
jgi:hypothetical protein